MDEKNELHLMEQRKLRLLETGDENLPAYTSEQIKEVIDYVEGTFAEYAKATSKDVDELTELANAERTDRPFTVKVIVTDRKSKRSEEFTTDKVVATELALAVKHLMKQVDTFVSSYKSKWRGLSSEADKKQRQLKKAWEQNETVKARLNRMLERVAAAEAARAKKIAAVEAYKTPAPAPHQSFSERINAALSR